jgi:hypothetical protein
MKRIQKLLKPTLRGSKPSPLPRWFTIKCCINAFIFCVHYLFIIGRVYVFNVGHVDKIMKPFSML